MRLFGFFCSCWVVGVLYVYACAHVLVVQSCPAACNPMYYSLPDSSVCGILAARILEGVPSPGDPHNPGIESGSPSLHTDSYTVWILILYRICDFADILSHFVCCLFTLLFLSFKAQMFLILIKFSLFFHSLPVLLVCMRSLACPLSLSLSLSLSIYIYIYIYIYI